MHNRNLPCVVGPAIDIEKECASLQTIRAFCLKNGFHARTVRSWIFTGRPSKNGDKIVKMQAIKTPAGTKTTYRAYLDFLMLLNHSDGVDESEEGSPSEETCRKVMEYWLKDRCYAFIDGKVLWHLGVDDLRWICSALPKMDPLQQEVTMILNDHRDLYQ
jgi:hypothetical protein